MAHRRGSTPRWTWSSGCKRTAQVFFGAICYACDIYDLGSIENMKTHLLVSGTVDLQLCMHCKESPVRSLLA